MSWSRKKDLFNLCCSDLETSVRRHCICSSIFETDRAGIAVCYTCYMCSGQLLVRPSQSDWFGLCCDGPGTRAVLYFRSNWWLECPFVYSLEDTFLCYVFRKFSCRFAFAYIMIYMVFFFHLRSDWMVMYNIFILVAVSFWKKVTMKDEVIVDLFLFFFFCM